MAYDIALPAPTKPARYSLIALVALDNFTSEKSVVPFPIIIAKTICTNFQNEMCIFPHFFAVRLPAWNII